MSMTPELEQFESHMDRMERDRQAQAAQLELAREQTRLAKVSGRADTKELLIYVIGFIAAAAVLVGLGLVWWTDLGENPAAQPEVSDAQVEQQREERCIDTGGGWIPKNTFSGSYPDSGMCVYPGRKVEETE